MKEVPFIGATSEGLCVDPAKVAAISEMPVPANVAAVQRLLGMVQYLSKFLPRLSPNPSEHLRRKIRHN